MGFDNSITYDEALAQYVGEFGRGQRLFVAVTSLNYIPNAVIFYLMVFLTLDPITKRHWECTNPADAACAAIWQAPSPTAFCSMSQSQWAWTNTDNLAAYFNMVCGDKWKVQLLNMMMFIGCLIGAALFGHLNDTMGRKKPLLLAQLACIVAVFLSAAAPPNGYWFMAFVRMAMGVAAAGQNQCVAVLSAEIAGKSRRGVSSAFSGMFWPTGEFVLVGLAYGVHNWRTFTIITGCLSVAGLLLWPFIPESARWLLSQGRQAEATAVVQRIAALNGTRAPPVPLRTMQPKVDLAAEAEEAGMSAADADAALHKDADAVVLALPGANAGADGGEIEAAATECAVVGGAGAATVPGLQQPGAKAAKRIGLLDVLRQPKLLVRTLVLVFTWFSLYIVSYGVNLGAGALPGSLYVTFSLLTVAELSAQLMTAVIVDRTGRHVILSCGLLVSGTACLACASTTHSTARAALAVIGKYGCTVGMVVLGTFTTELFATPIRASAMGVFNEAGRLGSIIAPLMLMVGAAVRPADAVYVPFLAFGLVALLAGLLTLVLPETLGAPMAENIDDMNQLQSLFSAKPWQQGPFATIKFLFKARAARAARMRRSGHGQPATEQQQQQQVQDARKPEQQPSVAVEGSSLPHIYVECAQLKEGSSSEPRAAAVQQQRRQQQQDTSSIV